MKQPFTKKILLVNHKPDVLHFMKTCLERAGFFVEASMDGVDAMDKIRRQSPDLIILDMGMPRKSSVRVIRELKQEEKWRGIPTIFLTTRDHSDFDCNAMDEIGECVTLNQQKYFLEKLISMDGLVKSICEIFEHNKGNHRN